MKATTTLLLAILPAAWLLATGTNADPAAPIRLPNRVLEPEPGIEQSLRDLLQAAHLQLGIQAVVQLEQPPTAGDRKILQDAGIALGQHAGGNAYLARIRPGTDLDGVAGLRWAGLARPEDKMSARLWASLGEPPPPAGTRPVVVYFRGGSAPERMQAVSDAFSKTAYRYGTQYCRVLEVAPAEIPKLAMDASVRWLEDLPDDALSLIAR